MSKNMTLSKLGIRIDNTLTNLYFNEQTIEVKTYLPIQKKLLLIEKVLNNTVNDKRFYNPAQLEVYTVIEAILAYTNITITDKQYEDVYKTYDAFVSSGLWAKIYSLIFNDLDYIITYRDAIIKNIYDYNNSIAGILESIPSDYENMSDMIEQLSHQADNLVGSESMKTVKEVLTNFN